MSRQSDSMVELTLENTSSPPWQRELLFPGVEFRWIPEQPPAGEYLMKLRSAHRAGPRTSVLDDQASVLWVGLPKEDEDKLRSAICRWCQGHLQPLLSATGREAEITIILGPDLANITGETEQIEAFMHPRQLGPARFHFLMGLNFPQLERTKDQEAGWLRTALVHELEHVWQILTLGNTLLAKAWRALAEMCAVYAEYKLCPEENTFLEFGSDFVRRLPCGLVNAHLEEGPAIRRVDPYWTFPFIEHLEDFAPGIYRDIWTSIRSSNVLVHGPWVALDEFLKKRGSCLPAQWIEFCCCLFAPRPGSSINSIHDRFPARLPTLRIDLTDSLPTQDLAWKWRLWPLSAHWIQVKALGGRGPRSLTWQCVGAAWDGDPDLHVWIRRPNGVWQSATSPVRLDPADGSCDILLIDSAVPDLFSIFSSERPNLFAPGARMLSIQLTSEAPACHMPA